MFLSSRRPVLSASGGGNNIAFNIEDIGEQITTAGEYTNIHMIGDSITNPNNGSAQGTLVVAIMNGWRLTDHCGLTLWQGDNNSGVTSVLAGTNFDHGENRRASGVITGDPWSNPSDAGTFFGGNKQFGVESMRDRRTTGVVSAGAQFGGLALVDTSGNNYPANNDWFNNVEVKCNVLAFAEAAGMSTVEIRGRRRNDGGTVSGSATALATLDLSVTIGSEEFATAYGLTIATSTGAWPYVNFGTTDATLTGETCMICAVRLYKTGTLTGFEISSSQGGGYGLPAFLDPLDDDLDNGGDPPEGSFVNTYDKWLSANMEARGWPNVIWIALGANDGNLAINDPTKAKRMAEKVIERYAGAYVLSGQPVPHFVLQSPYACPNVSQAAADAFAQVYREIAENGTSGNTEPVGSPLTYAAITGGIGGKISSINTRLACASRGAIANGWDADGVLIATGSGGTYLVDNIHPSATGATAIMTDTIYNTIL